MGADESAASLAVLARQKEDLLRDQLKREREALQDDMAKTVKQLLGEIPAYIMKMTLAQFLTLTDIFTESEGREERTRTPRMSRSVKSLSRRSMAIASTSTNVVDKVRRVTRSMTRDSLQSTSIPQGAPSMTPKFHPGLPETPAMLRELVGGRKRLAAKANGDNPPRTSNIFAEPEGGGGKIRRVTRATIRGASLAGNTQRQTEITGGPGGGIGGVVSVELEDGKMLDLDIGADPTTVLANMGPNMVRDLGRLFRAYAAKMTAFYKKCKVSKGEGEDDHTGK